MAGHSEYSNIKRKKEAQDSKRGKIFTKVARMIEVAARSGSPDVETNHRLRAAIEYAKQYNMPKSKIDYAIQKAKNTDKSLGYTDAVYECRTDYGLCAMITVLTDNRNRSASQIKEIVTRCGGSMVSGGVSYLFSNVGMLRYPLPKDKEVFVEKAIDSGATDFEECDGEICFYTLVKDFDTVSVYMFDVFGAPKEQRIMWHANEYIAVDDSAREKARKLVAALEDNDDVQYVDVNAKL